MEEKHLGENEKIRSDRSLNANGGAIRFADGFERDSLELFEVESSLTLAIATTHP